MSPIQFAQLQLAFHVERCCNVLYMEVVEFEIDIEEDENTDDGLDR